MKIKTLLVLFITSFLSNTAIAQVKIIPIWPGMAPGSENMSQKEVQYLNDQNQQMIRNVVNPTVTCYFPDPSIVTGTAVIVAPGGGFRFLSWQTEGTMVAEWLVKHGVAAFVLKYRVVDTGATQEEFQKALIELFQEISAETNPDRSTKSDGSFHASSKFIEAEILGQEDGKQAVRTVRNHAAEWGIKPDRIGIMGFSAGGMVALRTSLLFDAESRPDFACMIYAPWTGGTVPDNAPPVFVLAAGDDKLAASGSVQTYNLWKLAGLDAELHLYSKGGHGFGMQKRGLPVDNWIERFGDWMTAHNLMGQSGTAR
jgi:acetyl esterase/lipase